MLLRPIHQSGSQSCSTGVYVMPTIAPSGALELGESVWAGWFLGEGPCSS